MSRTGYKKRFHFKNIQPADPAVRRFGDWLPENRGFFAAFRQWLRDTGYSDISTKLYCVSARQAIGFIDKPYWIIDPDADVERFWQHLLSRPLSPNTLAEYHKGLLKFSLYLRLRCHKPAKPRRINWEYFVGPLSPNLQEDIRGFLYHCQRNWKLDHKPERSSDLLSHLTQPLRWMAEHFHLTEIRDLSPQVWFAYLDYRLANGIRPATTNGELSVLKQLVHFLQHHDQPICERFLLVNTLREGSRLPKDVPVDQLRRLQQLIQSQTTVSHSGWRRIGRMDLAWFLLMLHSGLRTCEVRFLRLQDVDWSGRRIRIEQAKGLKDRIVYLSQATIDALNAYLDVRGLKEALPDFFFIFRHQPLTKTYCLERLRTYSKRCNIHVTPHQLRHSCATLLLNSGAPILSVQALLGHKWIDTTMGYARLYDGTVAADYYGAMALIERRLALPEDEFAAPPEAGQLIALVDSLHLGTLNPAQCEIVRQLRSGIAALAEEKETSIQDVKVLTSTN